MNWARRGEIRELFDGLEPSPGGFRGPRASVSLEVVPQPDGRSAQVIVAGESQVLQEGAWSSPWRVTFRMNPELAVHALARAKLVRAGEPHLELLVDMLDVDPASAPFWQPLSSPAAFAAELEARCGPFGTYGWGTLTMPYKDGLIDERTLLEDAECPFLDDLRVTRAGLALEGWRLFFAELDVPHQLQFVLRHHEDPLSPSFDADLAMARFELFGRPVALRDAVEEFYVEVDRFVGELLREHAGAEDTVMVVSPCGLGSGRRQFDANAWLIERGYLELRDGITRRDTRTLGSYADWEHTRAYALGVGGVYVNAVERHERGAVSPEDVPALLRALKAELLAAVDPDTGEPIMAEVLLASELHAGPHLAAEPDLFLGLRDGYRSAWANGFGGFRVRAGEDGALVLGPVCYDNDSRWSGADASLAPSEIPGVLFASRPLELPPGRVHALQVAPTILALLGVPVPEELDRAPLR